MEQIATLQQWHQGLRISHTAHFKAAERYERRNLLLGIPVVVLSAVAGTAVFASLDSSPGQWETIAVGLVSVTAAVLASLQTFLRYPELAEKHKAAAVKYGAVRREVEQALASSTMEQPYPTAFLDAIRARWDALDEEAPIVGAAIYDPIAKACKEDTARKVARAHAVSSKHE